MEKKDIKKKNHQITRGKEKESIQEQTSVTPIGSRSESEHESGSCKIEFTGEAAGQIAASEDEETLTGPSDAIAVQTKERASPASQIFDAMIRMKIKKRVKPDGGE